MTDYNQTLTPGDIDSGVVNVVVEIPFGSINKIEWDHTTKTMRLDRTEPASFPEPANYGFIPQTISGDGGELDVLIISTTIIPTGTTIKAKVVGLMKFTDEGEVDDKVIVAPVADCHNDESGLTAVVLSQQKMDQISYHFNHYKDEEGLGETVVNGWFGENEAKTVIRESFERWNIQNGNSAT